MTHPFECNSGKPLTMTPCPECGRTLASVSRAHAEDRINEADGTRMAIPPGHVFEKGENVAGTLFWIGVGGVVVCVPWFAGVVWFVDWLVG